VAKAALLDELRVAAGDAPRLEARDSGARLGAKDKQGGLARLTEVVARVGVLHDRLYAEARHAVLLVLQSSRRLTRSCPAERSARTSCYEKKTPLRS
jgi:hypothetical protein